MTSKFVSFSPKIEIINHFDELINRVDIEFDECLEKYNEQQTLSDIRCFETKTRVVKEGIYSNNIIVRYESDKQQKENLWCETTRVVDYLSQIRMRTIEQLRKAQEESLEHYKLNSSQFNASQETSIDELRSKMFGEKFHFQTRIKSAKKPWIFNLFTFVTDFYMSQSDINRLESIINNKFKSNTSFQLVDKPIFDEKMVLISLLDRCFLDNLTDETYPSHVIYINKRDVLNIRQIIVPYFTKGMKLTCSSIDLSKLESLKNTYIYDLDRQVELEGLSSLSNLGLNFDGSMDESMSMKIFENVSTIKSLYLDGSFSNLKLDSLVNLDKLLLHGSLEEDFNYDLFKNLCTQLRILTLGFFECDIEQFDKIFNDHIFSSLIFLRIEFSDMSKLDEKKMFQGFPMLRTLNISLNETLQIITNDVFSSLTNLVHLKLESNSIEKLDQTSFSSLVNLENLSLRRNDIEFIGENIFSNLKNLKRLDLSCNRISTLYPQSFTGLEKLITLKLNRCKLEKINPETFMGLRNLIYLNLNFNKLSDFDLRIFDHLSRIKNIYLLGNAIKNKEKILIICNDFNTHVYFKKP